MASGGNKFRLLLQAEVNESLIKTQLDEIAKKYIFKLNVQIGNNITGQLQQQLGNIGKSVNGGRGIKLVDPSSFAFKDMQQLEAYLDEIQQKYKNVVVSADFSTKTGEITKGMVQYDDALGHTVKTTYALKEASDGTFGYVSDTLKVTNTEAVKLGKEFERIKENAEKFLSRSKDLSQSNPSVKKATAISGKIIDAVDAKDIDEARRLNDELQILKANIDQAGKNAYSFSKEMGIAIKRVIEYTLSYKLLNAALTKMQEGVQYIKDLNKEMTNIKVLQVDGARTNQEIEKLASNFNDLAEALGSTTIEVAQGATAWLKQGKTIQETNKLLESTMMLTKLGAVSSAEATEYLTSVLNAYKLEAEDAEGVVDKLVAVDNIASTSVAELALAMQRSAVSAQDSKVSMEQLIAMVGTVSSVTRREASSVGEALFF